MLRRLIALLTGRSLATAKPAPADPAFWVQIGNSARRAEQIAACFPEYWKNRGSSHPERTARFCLVRQLNEIPLHWNTPSCPTYLGTIESAIDPIAWCRINGNDVFSLEEAVQIAVIASQRKPEAKLRPFRRKFDEIARLDRNRERKKLRYSAGRPPTNPLFWRQLGHNPFHARRLIRCCPEYWFHRTKCSWRKAIALATRRLKRLAARLNSGRHDFYEAAETTEYEISKRDPVYWFSQGCDWNEAVHKVIDKLLHDRTDKCERIFRLRTLLRKAGHQAEILHDGSIHVSGPAFGYQKEYEQIQQRRAKRLASDGAAVENWPRWGPLLLDSPRAAQSHCCIMGPAAGGTDVLLRILMQSVANYRWLLFDGRNDMFPAIAAIRPYEEIHLLNPLDARASAWDIPADCATPQQAQAVVVALLPADSHHDPLLLESARTVLAAIIQAFNSRSPGHWNLMQFLAATETHNLKTVLTSTASTAKVYRTLRANPHRQLIATFLQSRLQPLKPVAAAWQHAARKISITSWLQSRSALVLGNSIRSQHLLAPLNRLLFQLLTSNLLEPQIVSPERTWVFLSDLCQIGRLEPLATLLARGAAAGVTVAITAEDVEMLQRHYPADLTGILALCGNYALLKLANPITARWASQLLGVEKVQTLYQTEGTLSGKTSHGFTVADSERPLVAPTEFQELPAPQDDRGPVGYFKSPNRRTYKGTIDLVQFHKEQWLREAQPDVPQLLPCPDECCRFPDDTRAVLAELGLYQQTPAKARNKRPRKARETPRRPDESAKHPKQDQGEFDPTQFPRLDTLFE